MREPSMHRRYALALMGAGALGCAVRSVVGGRAALAQDAPQVPHATWLARLPKVELHLHLEGAIPKSALWDLITKYGGDESVPTREDLDGKFVYRDFRHFLQTWVWANSFLREYEDYTLVARAVASDLARQNIRY